MPFKKDNFFLYPAKPLNSSISSQEAISEPPISKDDPLQSMVKHPPEVVERLSYIDEGENVWNAKRMPERLKLKKTKNTLSQIYRRLKRSEPSYTVTGSGGGGTHLYHWEENTLTTESVPASNLLTIHSSFLVEKMIFGKQIGMAVPVEGSKNDYKSVLDAIVDGGNNLNPNLFEVPNIGIF